jgi:bacterioferritin
MNDLKYIIDKLQYDLKNERKHMAFYTQSAVMLRGFHREELRKFCEAEATEELRHIIEFSELIVYLGGIPNVEIHPFQSTISSVSEIINYIIEMENEVAENYAYRLEELQIFNLGNKFNGLLSKSTMIYVSDFYTRQLTDSWRTAREVEQMRFDVNPSL